MIYLLADMLCGPIDGSTGNCWAGCSL